MTTRQGIFASAHTWQERLAIIVETMRDMSRQTDPQAMVRAYGSKMRRLIVTDGMVALSRRDLSWPKYRITRSSRWKEEINPWKQKEQLPLLEGGLLAELLYSDQPRIMDHLHLPDDEPAREYLDGMQSLMAIPNYDQGVALNMTIFMRKDPAAFDPEQFPEMVWMSNLFGRATHNLVLSEELQRAYAAVEHELKMVAGIQQSLLPTELPKIPTLDLAAHYQTSREAGGDYYDFFPLPEGKWGILIADVSGHGTPAAVMMAITHSIAHTHPGPPTPAGKMLSYLNYHLANRYTAELGTFVTAFYGIYDPAQRVLTYACAGHNPPRLKRCAGGFIASLDGAQKLPLGISANEKYEEGTHTLRPGDQIIFYTDGITEATNPAGQMFGPGRLDAVLEKCRDSAGDLIQAVLSEVDHFTGGLPATDDRTLLVAKVG